MAKASTKNHLGDDPTMSNGHSVRNHVVGEVEIESKEGSERLNGGDGEGTTQQGSGKSNGSSVKEIDRYGFCGGSQYTDPDACSLVPVNVIRKREIKWIDMLENWEKWMRKKFKKVKERCRKGIPPSIRTRAWQYLSGSKFLMEQNPGRYADYLRQPGNPQYIDDIQKDLDRQFPFHEIFMSRGGHGQEDLFDVLKAYTIHNPTDGYCQAQAPIAAVLLMQMPAEQAFWCLVSVCERYLPGYYSSGLEAVQIDGEVLFGLLKTVSRITYNHLKKQKIEPILCMTEWFMCVFTRTLPWPSVLRLWDLFLCEGVKVMFRVALVLLKHTLGVHPDQLAACPSMYETLETIRHIDPKLMFEEFLMQEGLRLPVTERDMEKEHQTQLARWKANKEKSRLSTGGGATEKEKSKKTKKSNKFGSPANTDS